MQEKEYEIKQDEIANKTQATKNEPKNSNLATGQHGTIFNTDKANLEQCKF